MSTKNFVSYGDAETIFTKIANAIKGKKDEYETITYAQWLTLSPEQRAAKDYYISDYPASAITAGNVSYDNTESGMAANEAQSAIDELKSDLITPSCGYTKLGSNAIDGNNPVAVSLGNNDILDYDVLYFCVSYYDSGVATYGCLMIPSLVARWLYSGDVGVPFFANNDAFNNIINVRVVLDMGNNTVTFSPSATPAGNYFVVYGVKWRTSN